MSTPKIDYDEIVERMMTLMKDVRNLRQWRDEVVESTHEDPGISGDDFRFWIADMKVKGLAQTDAECGRLLGISAQSVTVLKRRGADQRTALACHALLVKLPPYRSVGRK